MRSYASNGNKTCSNKPWLLTGMASPQKSASGDIDLFCADGAFTGSADPPAMPIAFVDSPAPPCRYHSIQLAFVTGLFACGGFLCSLFFANGGDDLPQPHHWLRNSYSSPVTILPPEPPGDRVVPQNSLLKPNHVEKTAAVQRRALSHRKLVSSPSHTDRSTFGFRPVIALRTKWTNFSENLREHAASARNLALDFGSRLRQCHIEAGRLSVPENTDTNTDPAG